MYTNPYTGMGDYNSHFIVIQIHPTLPTVLSKKMEKNFEFFLTFLRLYIFFLFAFR